jgi:DNA modification methylase
MSVRILHGDCREELKSLPDASVDAVVTDPPYELGFMGKKWDASGIAYDTRVWRECLRVLKPGGHLLAFGGTRTYHRMACAIEDAGFEIRDQIGWLYGSGFPKSLDVSKAIDKHQGAEREVTRPEAAPSKPGTIISWDNRSSEQREQREQPATAEAAAWKGWGTALKPAWEPIALARKPFAGTVAQNVLAHGTGAMNIDGCRVPYAGTEDAAAAAAAEIRSRQTERNFEGWGMNAQDLKREDYLAGAAGLGRFPANICHDGSEEVVAMFPDEAGAAAPVHRRNGDKFRTAYGAFAGNVDEQGSTFHNDSGSAARFFYCAKADRFDRDDGLPGTTKRESDHHLDDGPGGDNPRNRTNKPQRNFHPTVKPTALMRWLVRLVTPKGGTVLDPFMGSGSTLKAAELEGFSAIGIELSAEYAEIARRRIASDAPLFAELAHA